MNLSVPIEVTFTYKENEVTEQIEQFSPDVTALHAIDDALRAQSDFNRLVQRRRFLANQLRAKANHLDLETDLMLEEYGELQPVPEDYEPLQPVEAEETAEIVAPKRKRQ